MTALKPRDAATLILVRNDTDSPRILMGRRSGGHDFMPHKWVFPGGRIDRADYLAPVAADLPPRTAQEIAATVRLRRQHGERFARAIALTAVRETYEETGLMLARPAAPVIKPAIWRTFLESGMAPDLSGMQLIARAITPPDRNRRFDARFLMADAAGLTSATPSDSRELGDVGWFTLEDTDRLELASITRAVLEVIGQHLGGRPPALLPFWGWTKDRRAPLL